MSSLRDLMGGSGEALKRVFDIAAGAALLILTAPIQAAVAAAIAIRMGRPVLFRHARPGKGERIFVLFKFRTMTDTRDAVGRPLPDADRITALGRFLRRTSLDELPTLVNVLKGDMSLVGPRPLLIEYLPHFTERERLRHAVRPGITGWAQIHGRNEAAWDRRLALDAWYVEHRSFWLDLGILAATARMVFRQDGVVVDPRSAMPNLDEKRAGLSARSGEP